MKRPFRISPRVRRSARTSFRPAVQLLEDRLAPVVSVPDGFANIGIVDSGLSSPAALETLPDGRVFVALQNGTIRVVAGDTLLPAPLIVLSNVDSTGERGLLGITIDPNFASNHYLYVYYTATAAATPALPFSHNRLSRLTVTGSTAGDEQVLWELASIGTAIWHMGGGIHFGPDGKMYVSVGDHQMPPTAQSMTSQFGKILRLDVSGVPATIPTDNPFYTTTTGDNRAIWALGLRNAFTTAFQPGTGRFYLNDVGEGSWEEVNDGAPRRNFGWPATEGYFPPASFPAYTNPLFAYPHSGTGTAGCAVSGGAFYNPAAAFFPAAYHGKYFFQDFCRGWMKTIDPATAAVSDFATGLVFPVDLRVSDDGAIYYITRGGPTGGLPATGGIGKIIYSADRTPRITMQPADQTVPLGDPATFNVGVSSPLPVRYQWQRDRVDIGGATAASYTIAATTPADSGARFRVVVTNDAGSATSNEALLTVLSSARPTADITAPLATLRYRGGDTIDFAGTGTDAEDGDLPASAYTWQVDFHHDTHVHPFMAPTSGITRGSFVVPTAAHPDGTFWYRIYLTVRDSAGLTASTYRDVSPQLVRVTVNANHPGLQVRIEGQTRDMPYAFNAVVNTDVMLDAPLLQTVRGNPYAFHSWSDAGAAVHTVRIPDADTTYVATYCLHTATFVSDLTPSVTPINGWGPIERDMSNGEAAALDGRPIVLNGVTYVKGLGVHALSEVTYNLGGRYEWFTSDVGVDDETGSSGSVSFEVWVDGVMRYDSGVMVGDSATRTAQVRVAGASVLRLIVRGGPDGIGSDHADWANARLTQRSGPNDLRVWTSAADQVELSWGMPCDETVTQVERSVDGGPFASVGTVAGGATRFTDPGRGAGAYAYRIQVTGSDGASPYSNLVRATLGSTTLNPSKRFSDPSQFAVNGAAFVPQAEPLGVFTGHQDLGAVATRGGASFAGGIYRVQASGADVWGNYDAFHYVYRVLAGDGEIVARVTGVSMTDFWAKGGVMIRESLDVHSRHAMVVITPPGHEEASFQRRIDTGGGSSAFDAGGGSGRIGSWVRLVRSGNVFTGYRSTDGVTWTALGGSVTIGMAAKVYVGLITTAHNNNGPLVTAAFDNVRVTGATSVLPPAIARMTHGGALFQPGSVFSAAQVGVTNFRAEFSFQIRAVDGLADGVAFVVQGNHPQALGTAGGGLGYAGIGRSVAVKFDIWDNEGETNNSTGLFTLGHFPSVAAAGSGDVLVTLGGTGIDLRSGRPFRVSLSYDGAALNVTIRDWVTGAAASQSYTVDIPTLIGSTTGYVGFTSATGGLRTVHDVTQFTFEALSAVPAGLASAASVVIGLTGPGTQAVVVYPVTPRRSENSFKSEEPRRTAFIGGALTGGDERNGLVAGDDGALSDLSPERGDEEWVDSLD